MSTQCLRGSNDRPTRRVSYRHSPRRGRCVHPRIAVAVRQRSLADGARAQGCVVVGGLHEPARLRRCRAARWPAIYANDNFGRWDSQFDEIVRLCIESGGAAASLAALLAPEPGDISILKPRHSAFYGTPLQFLLAERHAETLIVTGLTADSCVLFSALDAFLRNYRVWVPRDCVAAKTTGDRDRALAQMRDAAKVWTGPSRTPLATAIARCARLHK